MENYCWYGELLQGFMYEMLENVQIKGNLLKFSWKKMCVYTYLFYVVRVDLN